jgi:membrane associated rhomboid family serine protease
MSKKNQGAGNPMVKTEGRHFLYSMAPALLAGFLMLFLLFVEWLGNLSLASLGLRPREFRGLPGILVFPFLHAGMLHLASNIFPFILLSTLIYNTLKPIFWKVWGFTFLLSGLWTWCFARPGIVIGASAWVYALLGFLLVAGFMRLGRKMMVIAGGLAFLYGGMVYGLLPIKTGISWEGHLMGLLSGCLAAWYWRKEIHTHQEKPALETKVDVEAPYAYWMQNAPHFIDAHRRVIHPEDLIWENGKPRLRTEEEKEIRNQADSETAQTNQPGSYRQGPWTITIS